MPSAISHFLHSPPLPSSNLSPSTPLFLPTTTSRRRLFHSNRYHGSILRRLSRPPSASHHHLDPPPELTDPFGNLLAAAKKPLALALFSAAVAASPFLLPSRVRALTVPPTFTITTKTLDELASPAFEHEYSSYTRRLLEVVSSLLEAIEIAISEPCKETIERVEEAVENVKLKRKELHNEVIRSMKNERRELRSQQHDLRTRRLNAAKERAKLFFELSKALDEREALLEKKKRGAKKGVKDRKKIESLEKEADKLRGAIDLADDVCLDLTEKVEDIDREIRWRESLTLLLPVAELAFLEKESELMVVNRFCDSPPEVDKESGGEKSFSSRMSKCDIQKELETSRREQFEQIILPQIMETEDSEQFADHKIQQFILDVKNAFKVSRGLQRNLEARIRRKYKRYGDEKRFLVKAHDDEVLRGFPEAELMWMFGQKEVIVPKAIHMQLLHGWKKWREEAKANLKSKLIKNLEEGRNYIRQRQENILTDRDRLLAKTWYNDEKKRWEIDPVAVPFAISKKLVEHVHIRQDWVLMNLSLKGDDKEYFVDIKEFDFLFEDFGGFDGLYMKLVASGTPTSVHLMHIPLSDRSWIQNFHSLMHHFYHLAVGLWNSSIVSRARTSSLNKIGRLVDTWMILIGFNLLNLLPSWLRVAANMELLPTDKIVTRSSWFVRWKYQTAVPDYDFHERFWWVDFILRSSVLVYVVYTVFSFTRQEIARILGLGLRRSDPSMLKLQRLKVYYKFLFDKWIHRDKDGFDPISYVFDHMKRVKNPPIRLADFASIDSMKEEINAIVAFLQNPAAFQEIGARAPRGVLIVGEGGTGKTSLALAIAAEAKVPLVEVKTDQMEAGLWVGQSAANVRELFQTARDLAPVIIFIEDFDSFAGIRGQHIHTELQDHEALINQFLVELDGFENQEGVVLLATATDLNQIDEALQRPGRMDRVLHLQGLTQMDREKILRMAANETMDGDLIEYVDWEKVAEKTGVLRPVDLKLVPMSLEGSAFRNKFHDAEELMTYCGWFAIFSNSIPDWLRQTFFAKKMRKWIVKQLGLELSREDLQMMVDLMEPYGKITNGIELFSPPLNWSRESKLPHAVWAAGRGLTALLLPNFDLVEHIWLQPQSWEGIGCTKITRAKNGGSSFGNTETRSYLEKKLIFCFGSYVASQMLLPCSKETFISQAELKEAQEIATRMVIQYGWGPDDSPTVYFYSQESSTLNMGDELADEMGANIEKIYNLAYEKAQEMLSKNHKVLEDIVEDLLKFDGLSGKEMLRILEERGGIQEREPFFLTARRKEVGFAGFLNEGSRSGAAALAMV